MYYSSFTRLKQITSWILRNCRSCKLGTKPTRLTYLTIQELHLAELYLCSVAERDHFKEEFESLKTKDHLDKSSQLLNLRPFVDSTGLLHVGGRQQHAPLSYSRRHPIILHHTHPLNHQICYMPDQPYSWCHLMTYIRLSEVGTNDYSRMHNLPQTHNTTHSQSSV